MSLINKIGRELAVAGALAGTSIAYAQDLASNPEEQPSLRQEDISAESPLEGKLDFNVFLKTGFHSKYRFDDGFIGTDGPVNQSLFDLSTSPGFKEGDLLGGYLWTNTDLKSGELSEFDAGTYYVFPISDKFLGGSLSGSLELVLWDYPSERIGPNHDVGLYGKLNYSGPVDIELKGTQLLTSGHGREYTPKISKTFDLGKLGDFDVSLTPSANVTYMDDFFGLSGWSVAQFGVSANLQKGNFGIEAYVKQQEPIMDGFESGPVAGISFSIGF